jgi:hypothetical protein
MPFNRLTALNGAADYHESFLSGPTDMNPVNINAV